MGWGWEIPGRGLETLCVNNISCIVQQILPMGLLKTNGTTGLLKVSGSCRIGATVWRNVGRGDRVGPCVWKGEKTMGDEGVGWRGLRFAWRNGLLLTPVRPLGRKIFSLTSCNCCLRNTKGELPREFSTGFPLSPTNWFFGFLGS